MKVDFFSAECKLCERTLSMLNHRFPDIEIEVHRQSECKNGSCCALAAQYGVRSVPSLVVDERVVLVGLPEEDDLKRLSMVLRH